MNLDQMTIAVRRRTLAELYDLALLVLRRHLLPLTTLAVLGALPWVLLDRWLLDDLNDPTLAWYFLFVLALAQAPLATAALTAYLGEAMFNPQPSVRRAIATAWQHLGFLLQIGVMYGALAWLPMLLFLAPPHAVAVAVLENQSGSQAWKRAHALRTAWTTAWPAHLFMGGGVVVVTLVMLVGTLNALTQVLTSAKALPDWEELLPRLDPSQSLLPFVAFFGALAYLSIVHFLAYLDLRTDREGWDIDLALRRVADRLQETP
jgi:hypothetical protein